MRVAVVFFIFVLFTITTGKCRQTEEKAARAVMEIEDRSIWDQMNAVARLPGDIMRKDFVALGLDLIIISRFLPLPWIISTVLDIKYKVLKFIHPAYWWLFPSTKPANVKGAGFSKLF